MITQTPIPLFKLQDEGARIISTKERFGLHDEMGVGKTATAWRAAEYIMAQRGVIVCPAMVRENWISEYRKFGYGLFRPIKGVTFHDFNAWRKNRYNVLILSYEMATRWTKDVIDTGELLDFCILDEAHYLKNSGSKRAKAILGPDYDGAYGTVSFCKHVWHLTGTPMANDPKDIYTFLKLCKAITLNEHAFVARYFIKIKTMYGSRQLVRPEMVDELKQLIQDNSIRRTKRDLGFELPPIFLTSMILDGDTKPVADLLKAHPGLEQAIIVAIDQGGLSFLDAQHIATLRRLVGEAKSLPYAEILVDEINAGNDKRVVFGVHTSSLLNVRNRLTKAGIKCVIVYGQTSENQRIQAIHEFQNDPMCKVFIGQVKVAGVGLTLTASCEIDILESDWTPAGNAQAIMRVHRIGQTRNVRARFITLAKSIDELVNLIVAQKTAAIANIEGSPMLATPDTS